MARPPPPGIPPREQPRGAPRKPTAQSILEAGPWLPTPWKKPDVYAMQALGRGTATKDEQARCLRWIIEQAAGTYDLSFRPGGPEGDRDTAFAEGRRYVGLQIVKMLKIDLALIPNENPSADRHEPAS